MAVFRLNAGKILLTFLNITVLLGGYSCSSSPDLVHLKVQLDNTEGRLLYLCRWNGSKSVAIDSSEVDSRGKANFEFLTRTSDIVALSVDKVNFPIVLVVQPGEKIEVLGNGTSYSITGSRESADVLLFQKKLSVCIAELNRLQFQYLDDTTAFARDSAKMSINIIRDSLIENIRNAGLNCVKGNTFLLSSILVLSARLNSNQELFPYDIYRHYFVKVDSCLSLVYPDNSFVKSFRSYVSGQEKLLQIDRNVAKPTVGNVIPPVSFNLADGRTVDIPGLRARLILIDFWADWCAECYGQPLKLKQVNRQFAKKGLVIVQVAAGYNPDSLQALSLRDSLDWLHVAEPDPYNSQVFRLMGVTKLPSNVLIDRWGRIIATNIYGDSLQATLHDILEKTVRVKPALDSSGVETNQSHKPVKLKKIPVEPLKTSVVTDSIVFLGN